MRQFVDSRGTSWPVAVNGYTVKRCRDLLGVDIGEPTSGDPPLIGRISTDIAFQVDLLYVVCKPKADDEKLSDVQFAERLEGDVLQAAYSAFMEEWADFFRKLRQPHKATTIAKHLVIVAAAVAEAERAMTSEQFDALVERKKAELGESFASLLGSAASTPESLPSAS